jgi:hypothetical protein
VSSLHGTTFLCVIVLLASPFYRLSLSRKRPGISLRLIPRPVRSRASDFASPPSREGRGEAAHRTPTREHGNPTRKRGSPMRQHGNPTRERGNPMRQHGNPMRKRGSQSYPDASARKRHLPCSLRAGCEIAAISRPMPWRDPAGTRPASGPLRPNQLLRGGLWRLTILSR